MEKLDFGNLSSQNRTKNVDLPMETQFFSSNTVIGFAIKHFVIPHN